MRYLLTFLLICNLWVGAAFAQSVESFDVDEFSSVADRAVSVLDNGVASDAALSELRATLVGWREAADAARERRTSRIGTFEAELSALGPVPEAGETDEQAARRAELEAQVAEIRAPVLEAEVAFERANALIVELDALTRSRQTEAFVSLGPSPFAADSWTEMRSSLTEYNALLNQELSGVLDVPASRQRVIDRFPITALLLIAGLILMWPFKGLRVWDENWSKGFMSTRKSWSVLLRSIIALGLPLIGIGMAVFGLRSSGLFGFVGAQIIDPLPLVGLCVAGGIWLGWVLRMELPRFEQGNRDPRRLHRTFSIGGIILGLASFVTSLGQTAAWNEETMAVLRFPLVLFLSAVIAALWHLSRKNRWLARAVFPTEGPSSRIFPFVRFILIAVALLGPILAVIGYNIAAYRLVLAVVLTLGLLALCYVLFRLISHLSRHFDPALEVADGDNKRNTGILFRFILGLVIAIAAMPFMALIWGARSTDLAELWTQLQEGFSLGETQVSPTDILTLLLVFAAGYMLTRVIQNTLRKTVLPNTSLDTGAQYALVAGTGYVGIFLSALIAISATGIDLSGLAIVAGALSVGIGFGLQNIVNNFISGIILLIERPIKEGDWIDVSGYQGYVRNISVRSTEIETFDRSTVIVPNADLITGTMTNYTHRSMIGRVIVPIGVSYDADPEQVRKILQEIAEAHPRVLLNPPPVIVFQGFGASSMDFEIRAIIRDVNWMLTVKSEMNFEIAKRFKAEGVEIPFAQRDVNLRNVGLLKDALSEELGGG
ncbi:MAG: mechanosensitive ion channel domain-containing protein [Pseudomonadota bacterium]